MPKIRRKDLEPSDLKELSWEPDKIQGSLDTIFQHVTKEAKDAINWYLVSKRRKKIGAVYFRAGAILATAIAGLLPMLTQIFIKDGSPIIPPAWASVALGAAAVMVALDRFFGFSSGWTRYIAAELQLRKSLQEFQMDWETQRASRKGTDPDEEQVQGMLARARTFLMQVNKIVQEETNIWIAEFQSTLKQIEKAAEAKAIVNELGGLNIEVTNGDAVTDGWRLSIGSGSMTSHRGKTVAIHNLAPGIHTLRVEGILEGESKQAEVVASVPAGGINNVQLTLN